MKKAFYLAVLLLVIAQTAFAEQHDIFLELHRRNYPENTQDAYSGRYPFTNSGDIRSVRW